MALTPPFNLHKWIDDNRHLLKPPVGNKNIYPLSDDYIVMVVAGPNARKDYHYNETEELFYQLEGSIKVVVQDEGLQMDCFGTAKTATTNCTKYILNCTT